MVNPNPDDQQETLAAFSNSNPTERADENAPDDNATDDDPSRSPLDCSFCGIRWPDKTAAEQCHPLQRLKREHEAAVTSPDDPHTGFAVPAHLSAELTDVIHRVQEGLREATDANPLRVAANVIIETVPVPPEHTEAWHVFTHLVFLQQLQVLPGYPLSVTGEKNQPRIQAFCNDADAINGHITDADIAKSPVVTRDRMYRQKVLTTTSEFSPAIPVYDWETRIEFTNSISAVHTNAVFNEATAHNTLTRQSRDWVFKHPEIDWASAPHQLTAGGLNIDATAAIESLADSTNADAPRPTYMFDFAGVKNGSPPTLAVLGIVLTDHNPYRHLLELLVMRASHATGLIVVQSRTALIQFLKDIYSRYGGSDGPDPSDIDDDYNSRPSIPKINNKLTTKTSLFRETNFVSVKQLADDIVTPTDILGSSLIQTGGSA